MSKVAGYREFQSKKGNTCRLLTVLSPYSDKEREKGCVGNRTEDIFLPDDCDLKITEADIDKEVVIDWSVVGGRAFVNGVVLKK